MSDAYLKVKDNGAQGLALVREETDTSVSELKTQIDNSISPRLTDIDGIIVPEGMELGTISFTASSVAYVTRTNSIRTPESSNIRVEVGDVVYITDKTSAQFKVAVLKDSDNKYTYTSLGTNDYTVRNDGKLLIVAAYADSRDITDISALENCIRIKRNNGKIDELQNKLGTLSELNTDTKTSVVAAINEVNGHFLDGIEKGVASWLGDHPEATTTVQDHSLTYAKLVNGTLKFVTPEMYGAVGDGTTDDTVAVKSAIESGYTVILTAEYYCTSLISISNQDNITITGKGKLKSNIPKILNFTNCDNLTIEDISVSTTYNVNAEENVGESVADSNGYNSLSALIDIVGCENVAIDGVSVTGGYTGVYAKTSSNVRVVNCEISMQRHICLCCSTSQFYVENNKIHDITNPYTDQYANYLFQATDNSLTELQAQSFILNNVFYNNINWDAIMSHVYRDIIISGNHIYNVRTGIDVSPLSDISSETFEFQNVVISDNIITGTNTDGDSTYSHLNNGITFATESQIVHSIAITGNIIKNFCNFSAPSYGTISIVNAKNAIIENNIIENKTPYSAITGCCVEIRGTCKSITVAGNSFTCAVLNIALNGGSVTVDDFVVKDNTIDKDARPSTFLSLQADSVVNNLDFDNLVPQPTNNVRCPAGSKVNGFTFNTTVSSLYYSNAQNQIITFTYTNTTEGIAAGSTVTFTASVPADIGVRSTDIFVASTSNRLVTAHVARSAANQVSIVLHNWHTSAITGNITIYAIRFGY